MTRTYRTDDLRAAYMPGRRKIGSVDVSSLGLTYCDKPIATIMFGRHGMVHYYDKDAAFCFAAFNKNRACLDD